MMGIADRQTSFSDYWLEGRIPSTSVWSMLRTWALKHLDEKIFEELFSNVGRPSVSPVFTFMAMLIQLEKGYSDRELEEASRFDDRVKYGLSAPRDFEGIDAVTLVDHRNRLFGSEIGRKIFIETIENAKSAGIFDKENLHVIDSFMVWGSSAKQSTYKMIYQGIKMVLNVLSLHDMKDDATKVLKRDDYNEKQQKPKINWEDDKEKVDLLELLVIDALKLVEHVKAKKDNKKDLIEAVELLERIARQDVETDEKGKIKMTKGTAKDRIISINDAEMRHGRKSTSKCSDGYKAEIITGGENASIVMAIEVFGANKSDGESMSSSIDEIKSTRNTVNKLYGDTAYSDFEEIEKREQEGMSFAVKVSQPTNATGCFTKDEFTIDIVVGTVKCPEGNVENFDVNKIKERKGTSVKFDAEKCKECSQKEQCTKSKSGSRTVNIHPYEDRIKLERDYQKTDKFKKDYAQRSNGERTISELTKYGGRQGRYVGTKKTKWQLTMVAIKNNIKATLRFIHKKIKTYQQDELCPKMV